MLQITLSNDEQWDEINDTFIPAKSQIIQLEHSLVSMSKWESKWCKPFLGKDGKTIEETIDYIRCMTMTQNVEPDLFTKISNDNINKINTYIDAPMTATVFYNNDKTINRSTITTEKIYYWMVSFNIPVEFQKWHLNRLLTLINLCNVMNQPPKKMSNNEILSRNAALNESRRQSLNTNG